MDLLSALSYAGAQPERRFGDAARRALERLDATTAVLAALHAEAAEEERPRELCGAASGLWRRPVLSSFINCCN